MKTFEYSAKDFLIENISNKNFKDSRSQFDDLLINEWLVAMENGLFKFKLDSQVKTKLVTDGEYSFVYQLNTKRFTEKRKTESIDSLTKPFDPAKFNFTKINENEILFNLVRKTGQNGNDDSDTFVIINNSPIEIGHVLLVPKLHACQNQILNKASIQAAVELSLLSKSYGFLVGFNSLCALASVNHLHFHAYYLDYVLPIQIFKANKVGKKLWILDRYYLPAFALQLSDFNNDVKELAKYTHLITNHLTQNEIAHNLMIVRGDRFDDESEKNTLRVVIWPRKAGLKDDSTNITLQLAICELSGHIVIKDETTFDTLSPKKIIETAKGIRLDENIFQNLIIDLLKTFSQ